DKFVGGKIGRDRHSLGAHVSPSEGGGDVGEADGGRLAHARAGNIKGRPARIQRFLAARAAVGKSAGLLGAVGHDRIVESGIGGRPLGNLSVGDDDINPGLVGWIVEALKQGDALHVLGLFDLVSDVIGAGYAEAQVES